MICPFCHKDIPEHLIASHRARIMGKKGGQIGGTIEVRGKGKGFKSQCNQETTGGKMKHTPTPWIVSEHRATGENTLIRRASKRALVLASTSDCLINDGEDETNADFIVRACNAHDELLEAVKNSLKYFNKHEVRRHVWGAKAAKVCQQAIAKAEA